VRALQDAKLTEKEQRELEYKRQVYELAKLRKQQQEELEKRDEYHMPTAYDEEGQDQGKRYEVLTARYR
jgi:pre-mRNA-splicing factor ATP-dependent RNA helicase DHX16